MYRLDNDRDLFSILITLVGVAVLTICGVVAAWPFFVEVLNALLKVLHTLSA